MASKLSGMGFAVIHMQNCDTESIYEALASFTALLESADIGIFYFAGHGCEFDNQNYLLTTTECKKESDTRRKCVSAYDIQKQMEDSGCKMAVLVLDCCRSFTGMRSSTRTPFRGGLVKMEASSTSQTYIALACAPNKMSKDGTGNNGIFTAAVLKHIGDIEPDGNGKDIDYIFSDVRAAVKEATKDEQCPFSNHSLRTRPARLIYVAQAIAGSKGRAPTSAYANVTHSSMCNTAEEPVDPVADDVFDFAGRSKLLFSFGSRGGARGLHLAMRLQQMLNDILGWSNEAYIDAVNLKEHKDTTVVRQVPQEWVPSQDLPAYDMVLNDNWAQFYYMALLACSVVVVVLDKSWKASPWTPGEWELFNRNAIATFQQPGAKDESACYTFKLIVIYDHNEFSEDEAIEELEAWGFPKRLQDSKTMIGMPCSSAMRSTLEDEDGWETAPLDPEALELFCETVLGAVGDPEYNPAYGSAAIERVLKTLYVRDWQRLALMHQDDEKWWASAKDS